MANASVANFENISTLLFPPPYCGVSDGINNLIVFWIEGFLLTVIGGIGLCGNIVMFYVLSKIPSKYNIFNKLLMQLVTGNSVSIMLMVTDFSLRKSFHVISIEHNVYGYLWPKLMYPFIKVSYTWIMCCTIAITIERYVYYLITFLPGKSLITILILLQASF